MNRIFAIAPALLVLALLSGPADAQSIAATVVATCGGQTLVAGTNRAVSQDTTGKLCDGSSGTGGSTANQGTPNAGGASSWPVDVQRLNGGTVSTGAGASGAQTQRVITATDSTIGTLTGGGVAAGATDSGNPVKIGGKYNASGVTLTDGQRGDIQLSSKGGLITASPGSVGITGASANPATTFDITGNNRVLGTANYVYNGSTNDLGFSCVSSAVVNVTAGNTTEIVALTASQVIRVCGFSVSMSLTGSAQWVYGTGTNCGSGTTNLTGDVPLLTATPWTYGGNSAAGSVIRGASANALCLKATTGNVIGVVSYVKY